MVKKGEEKSGIIKRADAGAAAKACKVLVEKYKQPKNFKKTVFWYNRFNGY